jgi:hypothetical protein
MAWSPAQNMREADDRDPGAAAPSSRTTAEICLKPGVTRQLHRIRQNPRIQDVQLVKVTA